MYSPSAISVSLTVATLPQIFSWFRQIPYTLLLVIVGLGLAFIDVRLVTLSPELILLIFLPPLLFEAAWNLEWSKLKRDLVPISLYRFDKTTGSTTYDSKGSERVNTAP